MAKPYTASSSFSPHPLIPAASLFIHVRSLSLSPPTSFSSISLPWENTTDSSASSESRPDCDRLNDSVHAHTHAPTVCGVCVLVWGACTCACIYVCVCTIVRAYLRMCTRGSVRVCESVCVHASQACHFLGGRKACCCVS